MYMISEHTTRKQIVNKQDKIDRSSNIQPNQSMCQGPFQPNNRPPIDSLIFFKEWR